MKKIALLLISIVLLSGCTATNGIVNNSDIEAANFESIKSLIEEQKNVSYIPKDVKEFVSKAKEAGSKQPEVSNEYLDVRLQDSDYIEDSSFLYEVYRDYNDSASISNFNKLIDVLDETISKGIKLYLDKNIDLELEKPGKVMKIGRVWIFISPIEKEFLEANNMDSEIDRDPDYKVPKNEVMLIMKVKDIKDEKYKKLIDNIQGEDLILESIKVGKEQNLIQLNNMESKQHDGYSLNKPSINYQLFVKDGNINKMRMSLTTPSKEKINNEMKSLLRVTNQLEFNSEDMRKLEEIKTLIKENKVGKESLSSEQFQFSYKNSENKDYSYEGRNLIEVIIERKKQKINM